MVRTAKDNVSFDSMSDEQKIWLFLQGSFPLIMAAVFTELIQMGIEFKIKDKRKGPYLTLELTLPIEDGGTSILHVYNLCMEIVSVDRDEEPMRFDESILDEEKFISKMAQVIESKLRILRAIIEAGSLEGAQEIMEKFADEHGGKYERLRFAIMDDKDDENKND